MNSCDSTRELLPAYIDNELSTDQSSVLERHLTGCSGCQEHALALQKDTMLLQATLTRPLAAGDAINDRVWARIAEEDRALASRRLTSSERESVKSPSSGGVRVRLPFQFPRWALGVGGGFAAAAAVFVAYLTMHAPAMGPMDLQVASVAGSALWRSEDSSTWQHLTAGTLLHAGDHFKTEAGGRLTTQWADGSKAVMGPGGEGAVLHLFPGVEVGRGEIWAKVKKRGSEKTPFTIKTASATAQVMGTEFVLAFSPERTTTTLTVHQGAVHFFNAAGSVTAHDWSQTMASNNVAPTVPAAISPLSRTSMWWLP